MTRRTTDAFTHGADVPTQKIGDRRAGPFVRDMHHVQPTGLLFEQFETHVADAAVAGRAELVFSRVRLEQSDQ